MFWVFGPQACGILVPLPGIEPALPALEGEVSTTGRRSLNHWTATEVTAILFWIKLLMIKLFLAKLPRGNIFLPSSESLSVTQVLKVHSLGPGYFQSVSWKRALTSASSLAHQQASTNHCSLLAAVASSFWELFPTTLSPPSRQLRRPGSLSELHTGSVLKTSRLNSSL